MIEALSTSELCALASHARAALANPHANDFIRTKWLKLIEQIDHALLGLCDAQAPHPNVRFPDGEFFFCNATCPAAWRGPQLQGAVNLFPDMAILTSVPFKQEGDKLHFAITSKHADHSDHFFELGKIIGRLEEREK